MNRSDTNGAEQRIAELIKLLPPAPPAWVAAAQQLPGVERGIEQILALSEKDAEFRQLLDEDLEEALRRAGQEPRDDLIRAIRDRLGEGAPGGGG